MNKIKNFSQVSHKNGVVSLFLNVPNSKVNVLSAEVLKELMSILKNLQEKNPVALLLRSGKPNHFIAGADIKEIATLQQKEEVLALLSEGHELFNLLGSVKYPTIAVIQGECLGGGFELALSCKYRVLLESNKTLIGLPEVQLGIIPGLGGTQRLPRLIGVKKALDIILTGKPITAEKAIKWGVVDAFFTPVELEKQLDAFALSVSTKPRKSSKPKIGWGEKILFNLPILRSFTYKMFSKGILAKTKGNYPAPLEALALIKRTVKKSLEYGIKQESEVFANLVLTPTSKHLVQLFLQMQNAKKSPRKNTTEEQKSTGWIPKQACVLGAGIMGGGIAWLLSNIKVPTRVRDLSWQPLHKSIESAAQIYSKQVLYKKISPSQATTHMSYISTSLDYSGFSKADLVIEAVVENLQIKKKVFTELEAVVPSTTIIATNTSSIPIDSMSGALKKPDRFIGMHFFSPVNKMPLVEVIPGIKTSKETILKTVELIQKSGKIPVVVADSPGFLVNRILLPYINEAGFLLQEGCSPAEIDSTLAHFGMPVGPLTLLDEVGLDVGYKVFEVLKNAFGARMAMSTILQKLYEEKTYGRKSSLGIYSYQQKDKKVKNPSLNKILKSCQLKKKPKPDKRQILSRCLLVMINEAARCLEEKVCDSPANVDLSMIMGTGFPPFRGGLLTYADSLGITRILGELQVFEYQHGERFSPCQLLTKMFNKGENFYGVSQ